MIVFVHGVPDTPALWDPLIAALGLKPGDYLAPAMPGFGCPVPPGFSCAKDAYAAWLIAELEKAAKKEGGPIHLVGHDWGALLTLRAASLRPDLIASWSVTNAVIDPDYRGHQNARIWATPILGELSMMAIRDKPRIEAALVTAGMPAPLAKSEVPHIDKTMRQSILKLYRSANGLRFSGPWVDDLAKLPREGQVFWGATDIFVQLSVAQRFCAQHTFPLHTEQAAGHWACNERAPQYAEVLKAHWSA